MKTVVINSLELTNFKGIARIERKLDPKREVIRARTGAGKSTLMYAWQWVLGLDVPDVIPRFNNKEVNNLEIKVVANIHIDDYEYKLTRTQTEEWKVNKITGIEEKHTNKSAYSINDVEFTATRFQDKLTDLFTVDYSKLEMLTNKDYFNTDKPPKWTWTARRKELFEISHTDALLIDLIKKSCYSLISDDIRKGFSTSEVRQAKMKALKGFNESKDRNVTLLEDKQNDLQKYGAIDFAALDVVKGNVEAQILRLNTLNIKQDKGTQMAQLEANKDRLVSKRLMAITSDTNEKKRLQNCASSLELKLERLKTEAETLKKQRVNIEEIGLKIDEKPKSTWLGDTHCPTCKQPLPQESISKARETFELKVQADLKALTQALADGSKINAELEAKLKDLRENYKEIQSEHGLALAELDNFVADTKIVQLAKELEDVTLRIDKLKTEDKVDSPDEQLIGLKAHLADTQSKLAYRQIVEDLKVRIESLKKENRELTDKEMVVKTAISQLDAYVKEQVSLITDTINSNFSGGVSFCLFNEQYAGAESEIKETCICMLDDKIYSSMSTGEKFRANLEVVTALQKLYNVRLPLFCDNAECYTNKYDAETQVIELRATEGAELENALRVQKLT